MSEKKGENSAASGEPSEMDVLRNLLGRFHLHGSDSGAPAGPADEEARSKPDQLLKELALEGVAEYIKEGKCKNIVVMSGAGISTSAGIPDFRSPGTGLYDNLQKYNLPNPQAIFEIGYFRENPEPFFTLSKELLPGKFYPTPCHYFIRMLHDHGLLLRHFTQNIDGLDRLAGVPDEKIMEAHGSYHLGHCLDCNKEYTEEWIRAEITGDHVPTCEDCNAVVKPDIVFFGESLPMKFFPLVKSDFPKCDLLIVMGTSLVVQPFASLINQVPETAPRLLINREKTGQTDPLMKLLGMASGMDFDSEDNYRDVAYIGSCDDGCTKFAELLGWKEELDKHCEMKGKAQEVEKEEEAAGASGGSKEGSSPQAAPSSSSSSGQDQPSRLAVDASLEDAKKPGANL